MGHSSDSSSNSHTGLSWAAAAHFGEEDTPEPPELPHGHHELLQV